MCAFTYHRPGSLAEVKHQAGSVKDAPRPAETAAGSRVAATGAAPRLNSAIRTGAAYGERLIAVSAGRAVQAVPG